MNAPAPEEAALFATERLRLRLMDERDADFLVALLNDPQFIASIGDREVRTEADALGFLEHSIRDSYRTHGFGPYLIEWQGQLPHDAPCGRAAGLCGLYQRDYLTCPDVGYALLPAYRRQGVAREAALGTLRWGRENLGLDDIVGIIAPGNRASARVLEHCGMRLAGLLYTRVGAVESELYVPCVTRRSSVDFVCRNRAALAVRRTTC